MRKLKENREEIFIVRVYLGTQNTDELLHISELISLPQSHKPLSCIFQRPSWCSGFHQCGELGLITSCLFRVLSNLAPSSSNVSQTTLDNTTERKWSGGRRGYRGIWISQEISSCNIFKGLWTISVTSWFFLPYWLPHRWWSFPLLPPPRSLFLTLPNPSFLPPRLSFEIRPLLHISSKPIYK